MNLRALNQSIRFKMLGGILILQLLLVGLYSGILFVSSRNSLALNGRKTVERARGTWNLFLRDEANLLAAALDGFTGDADVRQIYSDHQDQSKLLDAVRSAYLQNRDRYGISRFSFIDKDGTCYLRVQEPARFGDPVHAGTLEQARSTGRTASGLEPSGTGYALEAIRPYSHNGELVGFVQFGMELAPVLQALKRELGADIVVMAERRNDAAAPSTGAPPEKAGSGLRRYAVIGSTLPDASSTEALVPEGRLQGLSGPTYLGTTTGPEGRHLAQGGFPIRDAQGKPFGVVMIFPDITDQMRNERSALGVMLLLTAVVFVGSFIAAALYLRVELIGPIVRLASQAQEISMGNVELKLETHREDEVGLLIRSFERMRVSLKKSMAMLARKD